MLQLVSALIITFFGTIVIWHAVKPWRAGYGLVPFGAVILWWIVSAVFWVFMLR